MVRGAISRSRKGWTRSRFLVIIQDKIFPCSYLQWSLSFACEVRATPSTKTLSKSLSTSIMLKSNANSSMSVYMSSSRFFNMYIWNDSKRTNVHSGEPTKADARDTNEPRPHLFSRGELLHLLLSVLVQKHQRYWQKLPQAANKMTSILDTKKKGHAFGGCLTCAGNLSQVTSVH